MLNPLSVTALRDRLVPPRLDPMRRIRVPRDLTPLISKAPEADPAEVGMRAADVEAVWAQALRLYRTGVYPALTLCVRRHGQVVLDRAVGYARGVGCGAPPDEARTPVHPQTPFCVYSASKAVTATVVHLLAERGVLHTGDRVADYVPEFAGAGKAEITIEQVLSHRAGIARLPRELIDLDRVADHDWLLEALAAVPTQSRPGTQLAYHAVSGGMVLGEVVRRATGKDIRTVLAEEICDPLGFRWTNYGVAAADLDQLGHNYPSGLPATPPLSTVLTRAFAMPVDAVTRAGNDPRFLTAVIPSANVVSTANELSRFMDLLRAGGTLDGVRVLSPRTLHRALAERSYHELDRVLGAPLRHASGFMLGAKLLGVYGPDTDEAFGHLGFTNVMAWADPRRELAVGLITSGKPVLGTHLPRLWELTRRIGAAAPKVTDPVLYRDRA